MHYVRSSLCIGADGRIATTLKKMVLLLTWHAITLYRETLTDLTNVMHFKCEVIKRTEPYLGYFMVVAIRPSAQIHGDLNASNEFQVGSDLNARNPT